MAYEPKADGGGGGGEAASVFQLYQPGLASDHVMQLCYLRRRAPQRLRLERARIEDEFVLPRPELQIASLLPPAVDLPLEQLVKKPSPSYKANSNSSGASDSAVPATASDQVEESAKKHFLQPQAAAVEVVRQWRTLSEADWLQLYKSLQRPKLQPAQDDEMTGLAAVALPSVADVCWLLEQCPSDAFVGFVWDHLLIALLQQCVGSDPSACQRLLTLLVDHPLFASLSPKDFRAKVRSRNLRQVDDSFGAQAELALVALYRRQRDTESK
ncbi:hypothetical protein PHYSODRAFT_311804 [Phytophthora sojae]|uniref:Uncharacterized protein n=1 Tax=Phytophthora sojae (strain P6497) TaxID=1094619 RepID=G4YZI7_PHYSP|nr:hypothetical protein PHYSODRAFT_311804 [Phytophthora sojae]EGZ25193.1 hypothetical protein PHYSODRAFT_311804 [Phytophthora sojae]|eukprot:XP_009520481.1 hypothetical protein PHYSODRAFT_311804 [Phytophthora sojae]